MTKETKEIVSPLTISDKTIAFNSANFQTFAEALDYAAQGNTGFNFYDVRGNLISTLSYRELREQAIEVAHKLASFHLARGSKIAIAAETKPYFFIYFAACQYAGLTPVPFSLPIYLGGKEGYIAKISKMISACDADLAIASGEIVDLVKDATLDLNLRFVGTPDQITAIAATTEPLSPLGEGDIFYIQYSSGSTSAPKGVYISQRSGISNVRTMGRFGLDLSDKDRCVSWLPLYHDMGLVGCFLTPLFHQITMDYLATTDFARRPLLWLKLISDNKATIVFGPSFGYDLCARRAAGHELDLDLSALRVAGIGADMVRPEALRRFSDIFCKHGFSPSSFMPCYGMAEITLGATFSPAGEGLKVDCVDMREMRRNAKALAATDQTPKEDRREFVLCGGILPDHFLKIVDDDGNPLDERCVGHILLKGPSVMKGYYNNTQASEDAFTSDGWYHTGDMGYMLDEQLVITGRSKDLIILNGRNIWPQDIEWAVEKIPGVRHGDVAAFSLESDTAEEKVLTIIQCRATDAQTRQMLVQEALKIIKTTVGVDCEIVLVKPKWIPVTSSGKISRSGAKAKYQDESSSQHMLALHTHNTQ